MTPPQHPLPGLSTPPTYTHTHLDAVREDGDAEAAVRRVGHRQGAHVDDDGEAGARKGKGRDGYAYAPSFGLLVLLLDT
jgi:hypothetical protein